jgi:hypothetical protein
MEVPVLQYLKHRADGSARFASNKKSRAPEPKPVLQYLKHRADGSARFASNKKSRAPEPKPVLQYLKHLHVHLLEE